MSRVIEVHRHIDNEKFPPVRIQVEDGEVSADDICDMIEEVFDDFPDKIKEDSSALNKIKNLKKTVMGLKGRNVTGNGMGTNTFSTDAFYVGNTKCHVDIEFDSIVKFT